MQHTVSNPISLSGVGLHSGAETTMVIRPAPAYAGISFMRRDVTDRNNIVPARYDHVVDTRLCTMIGNKDGVTVGTIEHLMAALAALKIDNAVIELDGPEVPIMDGSSVMFMEAIKAIGVKAQTAPRQAIKVLKDVTVKDGDKTATLKPSVGSVFAVEIDFPHAAIGRQSYELDLFDDGFEDELSAARTFGFIHEIKMLRAQGLALGASTDNAIALDHNGVTNENGLRFDDEFVRHKTLDAIGDLYLAGGIILGRFESYKGGHDMNNRMARALLADPSNYMLVDLFSTDNTVELSSHRPQIAVHTGQRTIAAE